ncbi:MAG: histidine--tRNA ligase [Nitrospirae bacterium]|nr:histidine--tRNA ligase [Nitrospirota bacterium]MBI3379022.1 histidine--tRNA ligase [Nitrospirota bacterium]
MKYSALKGVHDILPPDIYIWQKAESTAKEIFSAYGFQEIRVPIIESTDIFVRSIGETTDIVEKEMYTFPDRADRSITLRPEGTAPVVRSYIENHLYNLPSPQKFFYSGPMFRYERPQKGRFRQFYQIGVEAFGAAEPKLDAEIISMLKLFLERLQLRELKFEVNSIGCEKCRPDYKKALVSFFSGKVAGLCPDCNRRYSNNPLRILDCKNSACAELRKGSPKITDYLCGECKSHFEEFLSLLNSLNISYIINSDMVRGLDYYTRTTFEITSGHLGAQKTVAAGGRYDRLVEEFGGPATPAIGFAIGMERLVEILKALNSDFCISAPKVFIATIGKDASDQGLLIAEKLRSKGIQAELGYDNASLKSQLRRADKLGASYVFIIGDDELKSGMIKWKNLKDSSQGEIGIAAISEFEGLYR